MARIIHTHPNRQERHRSRRQFARQHNRLSAQQQQQQQQHLERDPPRNKQTPKPNRERTNIATPTLLVYNGHTSGSWTRSNECEYECPSRAMQVDFDFLQDEEEEQVGNGVLAETQTQVESRVEEEQQLAAVSLGRSWSLSSDASEVERQIERELMAAMNLDSAVFADTYAGRVEARDEKGLIRAERQDEEDQISTVHLIPAVSADTEASRAELQSEQEQIATMHPDNSLSASRGLSLEDIIAADIADQPRIEWSWRTPAQGKSTEPYTPIVMGKWWSTTQEELLALRPTKRSDRSHVGRIMETKLGEQLMGDARCSGCIARAWECWAYSQRGRQQVSRPGDTCARCRLMPSPGGCSLSKRQHKQKYTPPPLGFNRKIQPRAPIQFKTNDQGVSPRTAV